MHSWIYWSLLVVLILVFIKVAGRRRITYWLEILESRQALIQVFVILILTATFWMYWEANEINRKATVISHTPWLSINAAPVLNPSQDDKTLGMAFAVTNPSASPVLDLRDYLDFTARLSDEEIWNMVSKDQSADVMPNQVAIMSFSIDATKFSFADGSTFSAQKLKNQIEAGKQSMKIYVSYSDIFSEHIRQTIEISCTDPKTGTYGVRSMSIRGYMTQ